MTTQPAAYSTCLRLEPADFGASESEWNDWRWQYAHRIRRPVDLEGIPWLGKEEITRLSRVARRYPFAVTPYFLSLVRWKDPEDPIRIQALPSPAETLTPDAGSLDPLAEAEHTKAPGLIHRYPDRVVIIATHRCRSEEHTSELQSLTNLV